MRHKGECMNDRLPVRSLGIDALYQYIAVLIQLLSGTIFYVIITRLFPTSDVGAIALFVAIVGLLTIVFTFGLGKAAQHFTSYHIGRQDLITANAVIRKILLIGIILSLSGFIFLYISSSGISIMFLHSSSYEPMVKLLSVVLLGNVLFGILNGSLLGMQKFRTSALISIVIWTSYYFGAVMLSIVLHDFKSILIGWIIGILSGVIIEAVIIFKETSINDSEISHTKADAIFAFSIPILFSSLVSFGATYVDRFVVAGLLSLSQLGIYNFALLISTSINFIVFPFANILLPKFSEWYGRGMYDTIKENFRVSSLLLSSAFVPAALGVAALSGVLIRALSGPNYMTSETPLDIISVASAIFVSQYILVQALAAAKRTRLFLLSGTVSFISNLGVSILLIPHYGIIGASIGFISVFATTFVLLDYYAKRYRVAQHDILGLSKLWTASIIMFLVLRLIVGFTGYNADLLPIYIISGLSIYLALFKSFRVFSKDDRSIIFSMFPERYSLPRKFLDFLI